MFKKSKKPWYKRLYYKLTLSRMTRLRKYVEGSKHMEEFNRMHKAYATLMVFKVICYLFIYASFLSVVTSYITLLEEVRQQFTFYSGMIGLPVFVVIVFFIEKAANNIVLEAQVLVTKTLIKNKSLLK